MDRSYLGKKKDSGGSDYLPQNYFYKPYLENGVRYVALEDTKYLDVKQVDGVESDGGMETQEVRYE